MKRLPFLLSPLLIGSVLAAAPANQHQSSYQVYTPAAFAAASAERRVLFFHATWCPTCQAADKDIRAHLSQIPQNVVVFETDYDSQVALKKLYGVTYQHTFVLVDAQGGAIKKWNGGSLADILAALKTAPQ